MVPREFDTHKAVKALKVAGFSDPQAEAVVETVGTAMGESLASKTDLELALQPMMTKADLDTALDAALESMASKTDLAALEQRMTIKLGAMVVAGVSFLAVFQKVF